MRKINPWIHWTLLGFGAFNILLGITLYFSYPKIPFEIVSPLIPQAFWATLFLLSGLTTLIGLAMKRIRFLRYVMIFGLFLKTMWVIGLLFRVSQGGTLLGVLLWGMIAWQQGLLVVYFDPRRHYERP